MSVPFKKPSVAEQFGIKPNPNKIEHVMHGGVRLTKVLTSGGHPYDSSQNGFPIYHRRVANPWPIIALGTGASLLILGLIQVGHRGMTQYNIVMNIAIPYGGFGVLSGAMFAFAEGNTFVATFGTTLGGLLLALGLVYVPWTGIQGAYIQTAVSMASANGVTEAQAMQSGTEALYTALGVTFMVSMIPVLLLFISALRTAIPVAAAALFIVLSFILQGASYLKGQEIVSITKAPGAFNIMVAVLLWYSAVAVMLEEEGVKFLPVFSLPRNDDE